MKIAFSLSLKISLWLLLNLLLLGAVGVGFLLGHGGLGWNALMSGAAGDHVQAIGDVVIGEINSSPAESRDAVLAGAARDHGADFFLFRNDGAQLAGPRVALPPTVRAQLVPPAADDGPPGAGGFGGPLEGAPRPRVDAPPPRNEPRAVGRARGRGRFLLNEDGYWIGLRVPFRPGEFDRPMPATLFIHPASSWALLRLLDVAPWFLAGAGVIVLSILFWLPIVRSITHALGQLTAATGKIAEGDFHTRVPATRRDELGRLGESVNQMAGRLDTLVNGQKRFLADVAHELGSPIGRLQVAVEILESRATDPAQQAQVADVREEVQQMSALVNELLAFTKSGLRPRGAELAVIELAPLVAQAVAREGGSARIANDVPAGLAARADGPLLARAVGNLVRNAIRYSGDRTPIKVTAHHGGGRVVVTVADEGPGVPPEALARLGEPFYRPEAARTRETGGTGLGLAIVRSAVAACGGEVHFANRAPRGFSAEITLLTG
jgi:two-component system sensor histidine kinase CpxA